MKIGITVDCNSQTPLYKQLLSNFQDHTEKGDYKVGDLILSMNNLLNELGISISKETVKKEYSILRELEIIESAQDKGFYISDTNKNSSAI